MWFVWAHRSFAFILQPERARYIRICEHRQRKKNEVNTLQTDLYLTVHLNKQQPSRQASERTELASERAGGQTKTGARIIDYSYSFRFSCMLANFSFFFSISFLSKESSFFFSAFFILYYLYYYMTVIKNK